MSRRRFFAYFFGILGAVVLGIALYLAFGDLGRHKERIEALVSRSVGRPFTIEGPFSVRLVPVVAVSAERVRLGNMQGGSQPQMVEFGKAVVKIGFWSLISGPPDVHVFELHDATVLLERGADGKGNWEMVPPAEVDEEEPEAEDEKAQVPVVIRMAQLNNVRLIYREAKKHDRVLQLDQLSITPGKEGLLALEGAGKVDVYPLSLKGEAGPIKALLSARDMRVAMQGVLGKLALDIHGVIGSLDPLDGADLTLKIEHPDLGSMLEKLEVPVVATGPAKVDAQLKDAGERTQLDFNAKAGEFTVATSGTLKSLSLAGADLTLKIDHTEIGNLLKTLELPAIATGPMRIDTRIKDVGARRELDFKAKLGDIAANLKGTLKTRGLMDSDLKFDVTAADAARLASVFDVKDVPATPLKLTGHTVYSRKQVKFDALTAALGGASVRVDGTMQHTRDKKAAFRFQMSAESLQKLRATWPVLKVSASGAVELTKGRVEAKDLKAVLGENQLAGSLLLTDAPKHFDVQLSSPRLDLSPFMAKDKEDKSGAAPAPAKPEPKKSDAPKPKFVFDEKPLPLDKMKETNGKLHVSFGELVLTERSFKDVDSNITMDHGKLIFDFRAAGVQEGTLQGEGTFVPGANGTADLNLKIDLANVRASLASEGLSPTDVPPLGLAMNIKIQGSSARQMAAGANGHLLLTQGAGKTKSGLISAYGGGVLSQLSEKLNPFAKDDPFMTLDCTIARADIVNGQVTVKPVVIQTEKVTITADGKIDLHTEKLLIDFNTRPRKGIGVSPGMFTNPLIRLEGTLVSPRIGMGAKGVASGALAVATGGATVIAGGAVDRMQGEQDVCAKTLEEAKNPAAAKDAEKDAEKKK